MNIRKKLFAGSALIITLSVIVGAVGILGMQRLYDSCLSMYENQVVSLDYLGKATSALTHVRIRCREIVMNCYYDDRKSALDAEDKFRSDSREFLHWMDKILEVSDTEELLRFHSFITGLFKESYEPAALSVIDMSIDDVPDHVNNLEINALLSFVTKTGDELERLLIGMMDLNSALARQTSRNNELTKIMLVLFQYLMLFTSITIAILVMRRVSKSISSAYATIDEQNKITLSDISYARKIQNHLLPPAELFQKAFWDYSIIWSPKDMVGGDMYWIKNFEKGTVLCVCDCTGHGTSGAFLTMLAVSAFDTIIDDSNYENTAYALWRIDQKLSSVLGLSVSGQNAKPQARFQKRTIKDGCDLAILYISKNGSVSFSSANMNVFICDGTKIDRTKGQRLHIGEGCIKSPDQVEIVNVPANPSNTFYVASDGLCDQIGGEHSRPFGYERFKQLALQNHNDRQEVISGKIWAAFEQHRGQQLRRDDVELITFRPKIEQ